ncbi:conserved hypothetical protein [Bradyrhizobium sp. STM 3843]|uniref:hypothetical protein n=1 Tax=unclassified Bradyrhizobium TaxID=2631580 RepID=UPI0002403A04|nr:hypothetical protein [Bradyrhizobium sp. STM 3843]CCE08455.1 conserved hypothetical protein [Bradyrhizobium sp. STM 3843]
MPLTPDDRRNERLKLLANWANTLATAIVSVGVFVPIGQEIYGFLPQSTDPTLVYISAPICFAAGLLLHLGAQWLLGGLR